jgi:hypothetical protein
VEATTEMIIALFAWLISHKPAVLFSHNKPAPAISQTKDCVSIDIQVKPVPVKEFELHNNRTNCCSTQKSPKGQNDVSTKNRV